MAERGENSTANCPSVGSRSGADEPFGPAWWADSPGWPRPGQQLVPLVGVDEVAHPAGDRPEDHHPDHGHDGHHDHIDGIPGRPSAPPGQGAPVRPRGWDTVDGLGCCHTGGTASVGGRRGPPPPRIGTSGTSGRDRRHRLRPGSGAGSGGETCPSTPVRSSSAACRPARIGIPPGGRGHGETRPFSSNAAWVRGMSWAHFVLHPLGHHLDLPLGKRRGSGSPGVWSAATGSSSTARVEGHVHGRVGRHRQDPARHFGQLPLPAWPGTPRTPARTNVSVCSTTTSYCARVPSTNS